ncbi:MAG: hypothetical protein Q9167_007678 [Letrouitia subvulpina]
MPPQGFLNDGGRNDWEPGGLLPSDDFAWNETADTINAPFNYLNVDVQNPPEVFHSSVQNGRDRPGPSLANATNNAYVDVNHPHQSFNFDFYQGQPQPDGQVAAHINHTIANTYLASADDWANLVHSVPGPPNPFSASSPDATLEKHGKQTINKSYATETAVRPTEPVKVTPKSSDAHRRTAHTRSNEAVTAINSRANSMSSSKDTIQQGQPSDKRIAQEQSSNPSPRRPMVTIPRSTHQEEDVHKGLLAPQTRDGSLAPSTHSVQSDKSGRSRLSFDFSRLDQLEDTLRTPGVLRAGQSQKDVHSLPDEKAFSIQIGSELFKLSGASIMSDGLSCPYNQSDYRISSVRTLFIDRDPETFRDIAQHLQVPRLISQLFESEIFIEIGDEHFRIPRDIFSSNGDSPNFFTLGFTVFFSSPGDIFPGLNPKGLLRPPAIHPPSVPNRSPQIFRELVHAMRGYPLQVRNKQHRAELIRDARYYNLRGLEQKLIPFEISHNIHRHVSEIVVCLQDIKPSGVSLGQDVPSADDSTSSGWVQYRRPYVDEVTYELIVEIDDETMSLDLGAMRAELFGKTKERIASLFQVVANKMNLPTTVPLGLAMASGGASAQPASPSNTPLSEDKVKVSIDEEAFLMLDGKEHPTPTEDLFEPEAPVSGLSHHPLNTEWAEFSSNFVVESDRATPHSSSSRHRKRLLDSRTASPSHKRSMHSQGLDRASVWTIRKGQWRLRVQPKPQAALEKVNQEREGDEEAPKLEIVMVAVRLDALSGEKGRNTLREFLV